MRRADRVLPAGSWPAADATDRVLIDFDRRHRRRIVLATEAGGDVLVDLPQAVRLRDGDGLALADGGVVRVCARPEALLEIHAHNAAELVRIAWHLGNRHLPVQLLGDRIRIRADHVIADMVAGLGGHVAATEAPFDPEAGAYAGGAPHAHHQDGDDVDYRDPARGLANAAAHTHDNAHAHTHEEAPAHTHDNTPAHAHHDAPAHIHDARCVPGHGNASEHPADDAHAHHHG